MTLECFANASKSRALSSLTNT
ncbi:hypothetical protein V12B01_13235 [Vibrio splendidus 12B01]|nr:hypothetical protein V12B01_13235 [Vibrio splendidus 12B01]